MDTFNTCFDVTVTVTCLDLQIVEEKEDTSEIEFEFVDGEQRYILALYPLPFAHDWLCPCWHAR